MIIDNLPERFTEVSNTEVLQRTSVKSIAIGRVVRMRDNETGELSDVRFWYHFGAPYCPLHHIDSVPVA